MEIDMLKAMCALAMAGTLLIPHIAPALGNDTATKVQSVPRQKSPEQSAALPLPQIPIEAVPWLSINSSKGQKVDLLMNPEQQKFGPLWAQSSASLNAGGEPHSERVAAR
jgi:hypothetical protein